MSKKYLIASGCSWTDPNFKSEFDRSIDCSWPKWPEILAGKLRMKSINVGLSGSGQEGIYSRALDKISSFDPKDIGLVIVGWSQCQRRDFEYELMHDKDESRRWSNERVDNRGDLYYYIRRTLRYMYSLQQVCESLNIPYKQFQMIPLFTHYLHQAKNGYINIDHTIGHLRKTMPKRIDAVNYIIGSPYWDLINKENFIGWPLIDEGNGFNIQDKIMPEHDPDLTVSKEDVHPNDKGHMLIAEKIYEYL